MTINELEKLREFTEIGKEEVENGIETIGSHEDGTIIKNPRLPFQLKGLVYVASHLMFDGCYRDRKGCYFYAYEPSLVEYHKKRLSNFGEVPTNLVVEENQLYFSYTIGYIASKVLDIETFKSTKTYLSEKFKILLKENKILCYELVKALIVDEGRVDDKIEVELANERLVRDLVEVISPYYELTEVSSRTRDIEFKGKKEWKYNSTVWKVGFSASSFKDLCDAISPLPIIYKNESLKFLFLRQSREFNQRKMGETKKLIVKSLLQSPKTMDELAKELLVKQTTIRSHLKGHPTFKDSLINLGLVDKINEKILRRGGYAKVGVYGVVDIDKANEFLNT